MTPREWWVDGMFLIMTVWICGYAGNAEENRLTNSAHPAIESEDIRQAVDLISGPLITLVSPSEKLIQLTGDFDKSRGIPTLSQTHSKAGVLGTDLGSSFLHKGRLCFLFGDTWGRPGDRDAIAYANLTEPSKLVLEFLLAEDGKFLPIAPNGVEYGAFCVPSYGISIDGDIYMVYTGDLNGKHMSKSTLTCSKDDGKTWNTLYELSADSPGDGFDAFFINVAFAWDRSEKDRIWMWGSGDYRKSHLYLARSTSDSIRERSRWRYFAGFSSKGEPVWKANEQEAFPLFEHPQIGEFSCAWIDPIQCWVLLYNSGEPRGIVLRTASQPWGPWSDAVVIFNPWQDKGYGNFMHSVSRRGEGDQLHDPGRENEWGGEYGPYLIPDFSKGDPSRCEIYYTMSTWNPYQVVLMRSILSLK